MIFAFMSNIRNWPQEVTDHVLVDHCISTIICTDKLLWLAMCVHRTSYNMCPRLQLNIHLLSQVGIVIEFFFHIIINYYYKNI